MDDDVISMALKIKCSAKSSSLPAKPKCMTTSNEASPKCRPAQEKESMHQDYSKDNERKEKKKSTKHDTKWHFTVNHKKKELTGLSEE